MYLLFRLLFPLITLFILNTKLILVLKSATKNHASLTKTNPPKKDSVTKVLVIVVTVFLICELPDAILRLVAMVSSHVTSFAMDEIKVSYANTITNILLAVNSSVNCLIYSITGKTFRKRLQRLIARGCCHGRTGSSRPQYTYPGSEDGRHTACLMNKMQPAMGGKSFNGTTGCEVNTSSSLIKETTIR